MTAHAPLFSIGHSNHDYERFLALLKAAQVTAIADVRTQPYSRHTPAFNADALKSSLKNDGIAYVFLGQPLGGRPSNKALYCEGVADYEKMAGEAEFHDGLERLLKGAQDHRIAMMCSEQHPLDCHRCLLIGRALLQKDRDTQHILPDGSHISQSQIEIQLLELSNKVQDDLFADATQRLNIAYAQRARKVAFAETA